MSATTSEPWNRLSACRKAGESFYFLADYHAMSTVHDANALRENCSNLATDFLAVGLDPEKCVFFPPVRCAGSQ